MTETKNYLLELTIGLTIIFAGAAAGFAFSVLESRSRFCDNSDEYPVGIWNLTEVNWTVDKSYFVDNGLPILAPSDMKHMTSSKIQFIDKTNARWIPTDPRLTGKIELIDGTFERASTVTLRHQVFMEDSPVGPATITDLYISANGCRLDGVAEEDRGLQWVTYEFCGGLVPCSPPHTNLDTGKR